MKIAICNVQEFNPTIGGIERVSVSLAKSLIEEGVEIIFISCRKSPYKMDYSLPAKQLTLPSPDDYSLENKEELIRIIKEEKIDIILNQNAHSDLYNRMLFDVKLVTNVKMVSVLHFCPDMRIKANRNNVDWTFFSFRENLILSSRNLATRWPFSTITMYSHKRLYHNLYEYSDKVVLLSDNFKDSFKSIGHIKDDSKLCSIPNMLSFEYNEKNYAKDKTILFCGRFFPPKNPYRVLYIWERLQDELPDWNLQLVGDGIWLNRCKALADKMKLINITFHGFKEPQSFYEKARIFLMVSNFEGWGLTLIEAMQYACVPVAFDSFGSIKEIIKDGETGFLIKPFDIKAFAETTLNLAKSNKLSEYEEASRKSMKKFRAEIVVKRWIELFERILYV